MNTEDLHRRRGGDRRQSTDRRFDDRDTEQPSERRLGQERRTKFKDLFRKK